MADQFGANRMARMCLLVTLAMACGIAIGTLAPQDSIPPELPGTDKTYHLLGFAAFVFPLTLYRPRNWLWLVPLAIVFGAVIELIQPYFGRSREIADVIANSAGALAGAAAGWLGHVLVLRRSSEASDGVREHVTGLPRTETSRTKAGRHARKERENPGQRG